MRTEHQRPVTKAEWVRLRQSIAVSENGLELLEHKRDRLMIEAMRLLRLARSQRLLVTRDWGDLLETWDKVKQRHSIGQINALMTTAPVTHSLTGQRQHWMSVDFTQWSINLLPMRLLTSPTVADLSLEQSRGQFHTLLPELIALMETESRIRSVARALKRCHRQVNALTEVVIPELKADKRRIEQRLEEKDRESIFQVKLLKARQQ